MGSIPTPVRIRRIGLVLEMEDGEKVMIYADRLPHAEAVIHTETPMEEALDFWGPPRRRPVGPPETSITITGIQSYLVQWTKPDARVSPAGRELEAMRRVFQ